MSPTNSRRPKTPLQTHTFYTYQRIAPVRTVRTTERFRSRVRPLVSLDVPRKSGGELAHRTLVSLLIAVHRLMPGKTRNYQISMLLRLRIADFLPETPTCGQDTNPHSVQVPPVICGRTGSLTARYISAGVRRAANVN